MKFLLIICSCLSLCVGGWHCQFVSFSVYYVGPDGWKKLSGDDVGELHYHYYPVKETVVEQEMADAPSASTWSPVKSMYPGPVDCGSITFTLFMNSGLFVSLTLD